MPLVTYRDTRPWAKAIREKTRTRTMPPWFADPCCGKFANDRSLTALEIDTLSAWASTGAAEGDLKDAPKPREWPQGWNLGIPDQVVEMPRAFEVPAKGAVEYQYFSAPTGFTEDRWVQGVEVRPENRAVVHHVVVYIREPGSTWTGGPTKSDILTVYAPGSSPDVWPRGMAKRVRAGSDLVFEIHYTPNGKSARDRERVGLVFANSPPEKAVLTLQMGNDTFTIPPGERDYRVRVGGTLPNDALLLGFFPHMHLRGKAFEYARIGENRLPETLLKVSHYDFHWQMTYRLATPLALKQGYTAGVDGVVRQFGEQSAESRPLGRGAVRAAKLGRNDDRVFRCSGSGRDGESGLFVR